MWLHQPNVWEGRVSVPLSVFMPEKTKADLMHFLYFNRTLTGECASLGLGHSSEKVDGW